MSDIAILFGPALVMALACGYIAYRGAEPGGVFGTSVPALLTFIIVFVGMFLADAAFLLLRWAWRSM